MTLPIGAAKPVGLPGGLSGFFQIIRPTHTKFDMPGFPLAATLIAGITGGTVTLKYGTLLGKDARDSGHLKVIENAGSAWALTSHKVRPEELVGTVSSISSGEQMPVFNNSYDLTMPASGTAPVPFASWYDGQTSTLDPAYTAPAINDLVMGGVDGGLLKATTGKHAAGIVTAVNPQVQGVPGGDLTTVLEIRYRGTDLGLFLAP